MLIRNFESLFCLYLYEVYVVMFVSVIDMKVNGFVKVEVNVLKFVEKVNGLVVEFVKIEMIV